MDNSEIDFTRKNKPGQGRKVGSGKFKEPTTVVRIPETQAPVIKDFLVAYQRKKLVETWMWSRNLNCQTLTCHLFLFRSIHLKYLLVCHRLQKNT